MKKRISVFLISILLCLACAFPVWAGTVSRLDDQAGLLDAEQQESLSSTLDEISERDQVDVVVVTVNSLEVKIITSGHIHTALPHIRSRPILFSHSFQLSSHISGHQ